MIMAEETTSVTIPDEYIMDESKKIKEQFDAKKTRIGDIADELYLLRTKGVYNYINDINPYDIFKYVIIILVIILLSDFIPWSLKHVVGFISAILFVYYLQEGKRATSIDRLKTTEIHMERIIPRPMFFYQDANFIEFAFNMLSYRKYNKTAYFNMINAMDHFLQTKMDIENPVIQNCAETYQVALDMRTTALNELHSLIHAIPFDDGQILEKKLINAVKTLQLYLQRHLDEMLEICNCKSDKNGWNTSTIFLDKYRIPGFDEYKNSKFHLF